MRAKSKPLSPRARPDGAGGRQDLWRMRRAGEIEIIEARRLADLPWLVHGFTTRAGGASTLDGRRVLNLGRTDWDSQANVAANRAAVLAAFPPGMRLVWNRQIHSDLARAISAPPEPPQRGDALLTRAPGLLLAVLTADCIPILLADVRHRAVAAIHAGWRGTVRRVAEKTVGRMRAEFDTRPRDVLAVLGPGIGACCYEVGPEVVKAFDAQFPAAREWFEGPFDRLVCDDAPNPMQWLNMRPPGHQPPPPAARLDLAAASRWQLKNAGVPSGNILALPFCTACRAELFFSHRREHGRTGRQMGLIGLKLGARRAAI